jgi:CBS domain-containing protein
MLCSEIMKRHVHTATLGTSALEAARLMKEQQIGFLPVCDAARHPVGVVTDRDLTLRVCAENLNAESTLLSAIMTQDPLCCSDDSSVEEAEASMLRRKSRRILVLDEHGKLVGLMTLADMAHHQDPFKMAHFVRTLTENRLRVEK